MRESVIADLGRSGISVADAEAAGMFDTDDASTIYPDFKPGPALVIPYHTAAGEPLPFLRAGAELPFCRVRFTELAAAPKSFVKLKSAPKYFQPSQSGTHAYFSLGLDWVKLLGDPTEPLIIVEGEKKALAGVLAGLPVIGLGGVHNFVSNGGQLLPELDAAKWGGRDTYICFDSDAQANPHILAAEARLVDELQRKRGARCYLVRLPQAGNEKVGLDDYLLTHGPQGFLALLQQAEALGALDAKIVALNQECAWIEREAMIYDTKSRLFLQKSSFVSGSRFSTLKHITTSSNQRNSKPKEVSIATAWLTHPHAQRFAEILFRPGEGATTKNDEGAAALNMWNGWNATDGDVQPWLDLTTFLFQNMEPKHRTLALRLLAYKAQNPAEKIPLALVLLGEQGCGKSLWAECVNAAFAPYSSVVTSKSFHSDFQGWLETTLMVTITEAEQADMLRGADILKSLISDLQRPMNEKYRPARMINAYAMYIITSNNRAVGAFAADDRRMIIVDCPPKETHGEEDVRYAFYQRVRHWKLSGGPRALLGYLLNYDLAGWAPPEKAPMTAEKYMAYTESLSPVQQLADQMRTATDNTVKRWLDQAAAWAQVNELGANPALAAMARATAENIKRYQLRPWYTANELALMFPTIIQQLLGSKFNPTTPAGSISRELRNAGVPYLRCLDDPRGFLHQGIRKQFLVVCNFDEYARPLAQNDFDRLMPTWQTYGDHLRSGRA